MKWLKAEVDVANIVAQVMASQEQGYPITNELIWDTVSASMERDIIILVDQVKHALEEKGIAVE